MRTFRGLGGRLKRRTAATAIDVAARLSDRVYLPLDYPTSIANVPRYGYGRPAHRALQALCDRSEQAIRGALAAIDRCVDDLRRIEHHANDPLEPSWVNSWLPGLDGAAIYGFLRDRAPNLYLEIGSGNSTLFAGRARRDGDLRTRIVSIDPRPRREIDGVCDELVRKPLEAVDLGIFDRLAPDDVLLIDGSHRVFMNSDVATFFLDVLPQIPAGVLVAMHDIYLPDDYPPGVADRYYSEQYMLAAYLLGSGADLQIVLPAMYVSRSPRYADHLERLWSAIGVPDIVRHGGLFWFKSP
jgi:hypothetical protein